MAQHRPGHPPGSGYRLEEDGSDEPVPKGQKVILADDEEWPLLELREITFAVAQAAS